MLGLNLLKETKNGILSFLFILIMLFAGFSQFTVFGIKPSAILIGGFTVLLVLKGYFKPSYMLTFFLISFIYGFSIGGFHDITSFFTNIVSFTFLLGVYFFLKRGAPMKSLYFLKIFNYSLFVSHLAALIIFLFIPSLKELVVDISSLGVRFKGFFTQSNSYAFILLISLPISLLFFIRKKNLLNIIILLVNLISLFLTQSRGALFGLLLSIILVYIYYYYSIGKLRRLFYPALIGASLLFLIFSFLPEFLNNNFGVNLTRFTPTKSVSHDRSFSDISYESFEDDRFYLINAAFQTISEYPFGLGFQEHHLVIGKVTGLYAIPHNYFISLILNYGILLGLIWLFIIGFLVFKGIKSIYYSTITPEHPLFFFLVILIAVSFYYFTHSPEWSYFYMIIGFYTYFLINKNISFKTQ